MKVEKSIPKSIQPMKAVNSLHALDLPPMPSPKLKVERKQRVYKEGCPPKVPNRR